MICSSIIFITNRELKEDNSFDENLNLRPTLKATTLRPCDLAKTSELEASFAASEKTVLKDAAGTLMTFFGTTAH